MSHESSHEPPHPSQPDSGQEPPAQGGPAAGAAEQFAPPAAGSVPSPYLAGSPAGRVQPSPGGYGLPVVRPAVPAGLATGAIVVAIGYAVFRLVLALLSVPATAVWVDAAERGLAYDEVELVAYDLVGILLVPAGLTIFVVGSLWLYQSRKFAEAVNPAYHHRRGAVWAWIGWIVPVVSLWFPFLVVADVRRATIRNKLMAGMGAWWACWLLALFCDQITTRLTGGFLGTDPLTPAVASYPLFEGLAAVLIGVACWLWVAMIRELTAAQREWEVTPIA